MSNCLSFAEGSNMEEDDTTIDVEAIVSPSASADDTDPIESRPIMILLKNLIRNKQNTVMTNVQIIDILQKEFHIDIDSRHELEVDIFIKIIKKFLKDWPQWEELERVSARLNGLKDFEAVQKVLNHKYKNLKEYLGVMLNIAKDAVSHVDYEDVFTERKEIENVDTKDVVMEVHCSRNQLNHLIYRRPKIDPVMQHKNSIFNVSTVEPTRIQCSMLSLENILNLWCFKISICLPWFVYYRELTYNYEHTLMNKARKMPPDQNNKLLTIWQMKVNPKPSKKQIPKLFILNDMKNITNMSKTYPQSSEFVDILFKIVMSDIAEGPDKFEVPSFYRRNCSNYKYVRNLYTENEENSDTKFDLRLEESVTPLIQYYICKLTRSDMTLPAVEEWLKIECTVCKVKFAGSENIQDTVVNHYKDYHVDNEPEWQCFRCNRMLGVGYLAENKWFHEC